MLRHDKFGADGVLLAHDEDGRNSTGPNHHNEDLLNHHTIAELKVPTLQDQLAIPKEMLIRLVKNKTELATLTTIGQLALQIDTLFDSYIKKRHLVMKETLGRIQSTDSVKLSQSQNGPSGLSTELSFGPKETVHQVIPDSNLMDISGADVGPPSPSKPQTSSQPHSELTSILTQMAQAIKELDGLRESVATFQGINQSLIEELLVANCPELAQQKETLANAEVLLKSRLDHFFDEYSPFYLNNTPWEHVDNGVAHHIPIFGPHPGLSQPLAKSGRIAGPASCPVMNQK